MLEQAVLKPRVKYTRWQKRHGISLCEHHHVYVSCLSTVSYWLFVHLHLRNINARSVFLGCKYAIAQFLSQEIHPSGHRGWIINTASMLGLVGLKPSAGAYCASKGAVVLLTKQIAVEYGEDKIHCNALCPGCKSSVLFLSTIYFFLLLFSIYLGLLLSKERHALSLMIWI